MSRPPPDLRSTGNQPRGDGSTPSAQQRRAWLPWLVVATVVASLFMGGVGGDEGDGEKLAYSEFIAAVEDDRVEAVKIDQAGGRIDGVFDDGDEFHTQGPAAEIPARDIETLAEHDVSRNYRPERSDWFASLLVFLLPIGLLVAFWWWMSRRARGQMNAVMGIGRTKAKMYTTERPQTTFADVAGYTGVKAEVTEVVDFLRDAARFTAIGARIPKGVLLVGPPGSGKTLIASSPPPARRPRPSSSWTRSIPSAANGVPASAADTTSGNRPSTRCSRRWTDSRAPRVWS